MEGKRKFSDQVPFFDNIYHPALDERLIMSPSLSNQVLLERHWRSVWRDTLAVDPTPLSEIPERYVTEFMPAIFDHDTFFSFVIPPHTSSVYFPPVMRTRVWVSVFGGPWQCEQTYVEGPLCRISLERVNE